MTTTVLLLPLPLPGGGEVDLTPAIPFSAAAEAPGGLPVVICEAQLTTSAGGVIRALAVQWLGLTWAIYWERNAAPPRMRYIRIFRTGDGLQWAAESDPLPPRPL